MRLGNRVLSYSWFEKLNWIFSLQRNSMKEKRKWCWLIIRKYLHFPIIISDVFQPKLNLPMLSKWQILLPLWFQQNSLHFQKNMLRSYQRKRNSVVCLRNFLKIKETFAYFMLRYMEVMLILPQKLLTYIIPETYGKNRRKKLISYITDS